MSATYGSKIKVTVFGQSHAPAIGAVVDGLPGGIKVDKERLAAFMARRAPGQALSTPRKEADSVEIVSGLNERGETCGAPLCGIIRNTDVRSGDYDNIRVLPRPAHSDYTAFLKWGESHDIRGGGQFSGRLTACLCMAGGVIMQWLDSLGIKVGAHLLKVGTAMDDRYDATSEEIPSNAPDFPAIGDGAAEKMRAEIENARLNGDSVGGVIECKVIGVPEALGSPMFDGVENKLAQIMFAIPAVKAFEMGSGFDGCEKRGSENNDEYVFTGERIRTLTNNAGGALGGITDGMPLVFSVGIKPTPSISRPQRSVDLKTHEERELVIGGRHDPCIALRAVPVVEACAAIAVADMLMLKNETRHA